MDQSIFSKYTYKVTLEKIKNNHTRLRDDVIRGYCDLEPREGFHFDFIGEPRDGGLFRHVNTSKIIKVINVDELYEVHTESGSIYNIRLSLQQ
jgi:hypothetical protein